MTSHFTILYLYNGFLITLIGQSELPSTSIIILADTVGFARAVASTDGCHIRIKPVMYIKTYLNRKLASYRWFVTTNANVISLTSSWGIHAQPDVCEQVVPTSGLHDSWWWWAPLYFKARRTLFFFLLLKVIKLNHVKKNCIKLNNGIIQTIYWQTILLKHKSLKSCSYELQPDIISSSDTFPKLSLP